MIYNKIIENSYLNVSIFFNQILLRYENNLYHVFKLGLIDKISTTH